jgi:two-component system, response regulator PdtaR
VQFLRFALVVRVVAEFLGCCDQPEGNRWMRPLILVVEDESLVRMNIVSSLEDAEFNTIEAGCSAEAIELLERRPDIAVIFTDIEMPGTMDGVALCRYVRRRWPPTILVISSGRSRPSQNDMLENVMFIGKPHQPDQLATVLRGVRCQLQDAIQQEKPKCHFPEASSTPLP